jgi:thiol-disulfide isomerase/thioredoxin
MPAVQLNSATRVHAKQLGACLLTIAGLLTAGCGRDTPPQVGVTSFSVDDRIELPALSGVDLDGTRRVMSSGTAHVTVLNAWASWCDPCRDEMPILAELDREFSDRDVEFIGLNVQDDPADARAFLERAGIDFPSLADPEGSLLAAIPEVPPKSVPSTLVLDHEGRIAARFIGPFEEVELRSAIQAVLSEEQP